MSNELKLTNEQKQHIIWSLQLCLAKFRETLTYSRSDEMIQATLKQIHEFETLIKQLKETK